MTSKKNFENRTRGWFPQEPLQTYSIIKASLSKAEFDKKIFKASLIANAIMLNIFLGTNFLLIKPRYESITVSVLQWSVYVPVVIVVNILVYLHYKRQLLPVGGF
jgi:uncharacterized membrane protein YwaF